LSARNAPACAALLRLTAATSKNLEKKFLKRMQERKNALSGVLTASVLGLIELQNKGLKRVESRKDINGRYRGIDGKGF